MFFLSKHFPKKPNKNAIKPQNILDTTFTHVRNPRNLTNIIKMILAEDDMDFDSEASGISLRKLPRSRSMPHVNPQKLRLIQQDSTASNGSLFNKDSGIVDEHHSGLSVGVIPEALADVVQGDFASGGSGMLASEPQSEVEVAEHQILGGF